MSEERIDVKALREGLGWTQQQLADYCDTERSNISKWEKEAPTKGPALILLRQLRDRAQSQRCTSLHPDDFDAVRGVAAGPDVPQAGAGLSHLHEAAE